MKNLKPTVCALLKLQNWRQFYNDILTFKNYVLFFVLEVRTPTRVSF